ncbi:MAG: bifunctional folylpolyglutamate synthase/dihydrofolate synthase [Thermoguttaceae bacterium]|nr:bifunctional folylpolyglutamate synthase/dihydrofolate synthase [Thermoguttaceae bacterium]
MGRYALLNSHLDRELRTGYSAGELSLGPLTELLSKLGDPQKRFPAVHITGTKGKGSTAAMLASVLQEAGLRVGVYASPHILALEERIRINGAFIPETRLTEILEEKLRPCTEEMEAEGWTFSFFELLTAAAFVYFAEEKVDCAVLESGMGGRTDAVTVCEPLLTIISNVALDHTQQLGETLEEIAREKAGILKPKVPLVVGSMPAEVREKVYPVIHGIAQELHVPESWAGIHFPDAVLPFLEVGMAGEHQKMNAACVGQAVRILGVLAPEWKLEMPHLWEGLKKAHLPGRLELVSREPLTLLDAAHTPESMAYAVEWVQENFQEMPKEILFAASRDKNWRKMLELLLTLTPKRILLTEFTQERSASAEEMETFLKERAPELCVEREGIPQDAVERLLREWKDDRTAGEAGASENCFGLLFVTGSFFLLREIYGLFRT